jgi:hypothetical protein
MTGIIVATTRYSAATQRYTLARGAGSASDAVEHSLRAARSKKVAPRPQLRRCRSA